MNASIFAVKKKIKKIKISKNQTIFKAEQFSPIFSPFNRVFLIQNDYGG